MWFYFISRDITYTSKTNESTFRPHTRVLFFHSKPLFWGQIPYLQLGGSNSRVKDRIYFLESLTLKYSNYFHGMFIDKIKIILFAGAACILQRFHSKFRPTWVVECDYVFDFGAGNSNCFLTYSQNVCISVLAWALKWSIFRFHYCLKLHNLII